MIRDEPEDYSVYAPGCTILGGENYPCLAGEPNPWPPRINTFRDTVMRVQAAKSKRFMALQGDGTGLGKREPTPAELRWMTYMSLIHGVTNALYWDYQHAVQTPSLISNIATVVGEIRTKNVDDILDGTNLDWQATDKNSVTDYAYRLYNGVYYLLAAHRDPGTTTGGTAFFICGVNGQQIRYAQDILTGTTVSGTMQGTNFHFSPTIDRGAVKVYQLVT